MTELIDEGVQKTNDTPEEKKVDAVESPEKALYKDDEKPEDKSEDKLEDKKEDEKSEDKKEDNPEDKKDDEKSEDKKVDDEKKEADEKKADDEKKVGKKEDKPEDIVLKMPENSLLLQERIDEIATIAKEQGLSQDTAQMMVDREQDAVGQYAANAKAHLDNLADVVWIEETKNDAEIGGEKFKENVEFAKRAFKKYGSDKFNEILNESGYGNHPENIRAWSRVGRDMSDDTLIHGKNEINTKKSPVDILYGGDKKKE